MKRRLVLCIALAMTSVATGDEKGEFSPLFDGKTFAGWEGNLGMFRIVDGAIVAGNLKEAIPHNEFLCTQEEFQDFELRLKAKLIGDGDNAGIQFRSKRIPDHHEVKGYQCDMGSAFDGKVWGALYDESRRRRMLAEPDQSKLLRVLKEDEWNQFVVRCEGKRIRIWLNDLLTVDYEEKDDVATTGIIGLQIHGGKPAEAWYKDIQIRRL